VQIRADELAIDVPRLGRVPRHVFWILIAMSVMGLMGFGYVSLELLHMRRRISSAERRGFNPYVSGEPVRRAEMFFGRHALLQRIVDTLHQNSIMLYGERRIGKTTLLHQIVNRLQMVEDPGYWFVPVYVDLEGTPQEAFFHVLMEEILRAVQAVPDGARLVDGADDGLAFHSTPAAHYSDRIFTRDLRRVVRQLQTVGARRHPHKQLRIILLLDEVDVMSNYDSLVQQQLRRIFMRDFAVALGAVVAGVQISHAWDRVESPWYNLFNEIAVEPFTAAQARALLTHPVRGIYSFAPDALDFIIAQSAGRPFRVQQYGLEAVAHMLARGRRRVELVDVQAAHDAIAARISHSEK